MSIQAMWKNNWDWSPAYPQGNSISRLQSKNFSGTCKWPQMRELHLKSMYNCTGVWYDDQFQFLVTFLEPTNYPSSFFIPFLPCTCYRCVSFSGLDSNSIVSSRKCVLLCFMIISWVQDYFFSRVSTLKLAPISTHMSINPLIDKKYFGAELRRK